MTNQELRQICEQYLNKYSAMSTEITRETIRLLAENEAMRGVVEAARSTCDHWPHRGLSSLHEALEKLPPEAWNE